MAQPAENPSRKEFGHVAVVTGANKGIGFGIVKTLCRRYQGYIYLTSRNETKGKAALKKILDEQQCKRPENVRYHQLDITSRESILKLHDDIVDKHGGLDILVNNAAIAYPISSIGDFGVEANITIHTNFMCLVTLCHILFPILRPHARVVNIGSSAGLLDNLQRTEEGGALKRRLMDPKMTEEGLVELMNEFVAHCQEGTHVTAGWPDSAYSASKIGVSKLTFIQQDTLDKSPKPDIIVNVVHPGPVKTDMNPRGSLTIEEGAKPVIYVSMLPHNASSPRGKFIWHDYYIIPWDTQQAPINPSLSVAHQIYWNKPLLFAPNSTDSIEFYEVVTKVKYTLVSQRPYLGDLNATNL